MKLGKLLCGVSLLSVPGMPSITTIPSVIKHKTTKSQTTEKASSSIVGNVQQPKGASQGNQNPSAGTQAVRETKANTSHKRSSATKKPRSLYPAAMLGSAMVSRGEIGFLISSIAESNGVFSSQGDESGSSPIFLIVTWAILLCTLLGPLTVGLMVRRVKKLQKAERGGRSGKVDPLGS